MICLTGRSEILHTQIPWVTEGTVTNSLGFPGVSGGFITGKYRRDEK